MKRPITLLFDATIIADGITKRNYIRSGIYWVAYNLLQQFCNNSNYNVILYTHPHSFFIKYKVLKEFKLKKIITYYDKVICKKKIISSKVIIKKTINPLRIIYLILRIIRNQYFIYKAAGFVKNIKNIDICFSPMYHVPVEIIKNKLIKTFQILYDCIPTLFKEHYPDLDDNHWYSHMINNLNKETVYFCISECTKNDFIKYYSEKINKENLLVTYLAPGNNLQSNHKMSLKNIYTKYKITFNSEYIYSLCTIQPRKNLLFSIECFIKFIRKHNINNLYYYLGGGYFPYYIKYFKEHISDYDNYKNKIILLGYIDDEDIYTFYSNSLFFVFLPMYEGFGIPVLEAIQSGTPVICSNNSSLPEVAGDAAIQIAYNDENSCIKAFENFYFNENLRKEYIEKGIERAKQFSWEKTFNIINNAIVENINDTNSGC